VVVVVVGAGGEKQTWQIPEEKAKRAASRSTERRGPGGQCANPLTSSLGLKPGVYVIFKNENFRRKI
jgi:hypothetical protein